MVAGGAFTKTNKCAVLGHETILLKVIVYTIAQSGWRLNPSCHRAGCGVALSGLPHYTAKRSGVSGVGRLFTACAQQPERTQST